MPKPREISLQLQYEKRGGRFYINCPDLPGFRLAGADLDALQADLPTVIKDLLWHNLKIIADKLRWVPSLEDVAKHLKKPEPEGSATYVVKVKRAA